MGRGRRISPTRIRVVAALVVRNERPFMGNCLRHLIENGIDYVIVDNGSTDETIELLQQSYFAKHLISYRTHPYQGYMDWEDLMQARQAVADAVDADWILYVSAGRSCVLTMSTKRLVLPLSGSMPPGLMLSISTSLLFSDRNELCAGSRRVQLLRYYYFFEDQRPRLMRARKKHLQVSHVEHGGHLLAGEPFRL